MTVASLGDPMITQMLEEALVASKVTLNIPGSPLRNVSGNTGIVTRAASIVTGNNTSIVPGVKNASAIWKNSTLSKHSLLKHVYIMHD